MDGSERDDLSVPPTEGDSLDHLLARAVAAPPTQPLLAPRTVLAERYEIERVLGVGGMGAVYLAHDRTLDRAIALKLHRTTPLTTRLHREAIAMARLAHPNVVTVFEVGTIEERTFVAMEYIQGATLRGWLSEEKRAHGDILDALLEAGEGLAAAHAAGLVHRDVKPDNILVGVDGRVRVGDFGLAQVKQEATSPARPMRLTIDSATATGTVVGTPAYMAPEQIQGGTLDARTDQFGFCVVAWESLHGERPFTGADTLELLAAIQRGIPNTAGRRVPSRLRSVLQRGLAGDPAVRWPSMSALLAALRSAWRRPRVIAAASALLLVATGSTAWAMWPAADPVAACDGVTSELEHQFPRAEQSALLAKIRAGTPEAVRRAAMIETELDKTRDRARTATVSACRARASRQWSSALAVASSECLLDHARTVRELFAQGAGRLDATDVSLLTVQLPDLEHCADARLLAGWRPLSPDRRETSAVIDARAQVAAADAVLAMGQVEAAASLYAKIRTLPVLATPAAQGRAKLFAGRLAIAKGEYTSAETLLADTYFAARAADDAELSLGAVKSLILLAADVRRDPVATARWVRDGVADAERDRMRQPSSAASVLIAAASASEATAPQLVLDYAEQARKILGAGNAPMMDFAIRDLRVEGLARLGRTDEALAVSSENIEAMRMLLGTDHPVIARALSARAALLLDVNRTPEAHLAAKEAAKILDAGALSPSLIYALTELNLGASLLGDDDVRARTYLERARARWVASYGEDHPDVALVDSNLALIYLAEGDKAAAFKALRHGIAVQTRVLGPEHPELAASYFNLAVAERENGEHEAELADAQRAAAIFAVRAPGSSRHVSSLALVAQAFNLLGRHREALAVVDQVFAMPPDKDDPTSWAWSQVEAAQAWIALREAGRAKPLLMLARATYAEMKMEPRVAAITATLAKLP